MEKNKLLTCQFCGETGTMDEFEIDILRKGFWCECCDGYTYLNPEDKEKHKFMLILEDKSKRHTKRITSSVKFNKRLSLLRYPGGKSKIIDYIYLKINPLNTDRFVEPFAGGSSVGLALLDAGLIKELILNDKDYGIYSLFYIIKNSPEELIDKIQSIVPSHTDYLEAQQKIKDDYKGCNNLEAAWSLLVVNRLAYSGIFKANPLGGKNGSSEKLLSRWNPNELCKRIQKINEMSSNITVLNLDACELIEEMYWEPSTTIFIDPPYYNQGKNLYHCYYKKEDHVELSTLLNSLYQGMPGADMIVTYDNDEFIKWLYLYPEIENISRVYTI